MSASTSASPSSLSQQPLNPLNPLAIKLASPSTHTKRQRSGPSCDCCRSRKIKCDSEIFILSALDSINLEDNLVPTSINSHIAYCEFISSNPDSGYQYYKIIKDEEHALNNKLTSFNYLQFKPCSACITKNLKCCFSKGFTRNDIIKFNKTEKLNNNSIPNQSSISSPSTTSLGSINLQLSSLNVSSNLPSPSISIPTSPPTQTNDSIQIKQESEISSNISNLFKKNQLLTPSPTPALDSDTSFTNHKIESDSEQEHEKLKIDIIKDAKATKDFENTKDATKNIKNTKDFKNLKNIKDIKETKKVKEFKERKSSKKTSCKTCRFKKIKCVKIDNSELCVYCNKKGIGCLFE
jgi:hypothetical protein